MKNDACKSVETGAILSATLVGFLAVAAALALALSACAGKASSSPMPSSAPEASSTPQVPSSALSSSAKPSVQASSSTEKSSSEKPLLSSSAAVHYTVSIYQSYYIEEKGEYGNPRFDTSVTREAGQPLYKNVKEIQALEECLGPEYYSIGGSGLYELIGFFLNDKCTISIGYSQIVNSDMDVFYYCRG